MNTKRFVLASGSVFLFIFTYEWIFHSVVLKEVYQQTANLWRPESDMKFYFIWLTLGQFLFSMIFSLFFLRGYENKGLMEGVKYGAMMGVFFCAPNLIWYAVQPLPGSLVAQWCLGGLIEITLAGAILASIYRPNEN